jgi:uncharacterized membrane protein
MVLIAMTALALAVVAAVVASGPGPARLAIALAALIPLLLPLRGVLAGSRRTHAWATLCVAPYLVAGVTESIANPPLRLLAALVVLASVAWFVALIGYLRVTRAAAVPPPGPA